MTENGGPVSGLSVSSDASSSGAIVLIDASNSMKGAPIAGAMVAARAFLAKGKQDLRSRSSPTTRGHGPHGLHDVGSELTAAVATAPETAEGTAIYDALIKAAELAEEQGLPRTTAVLLSDGHRRGSAGVAARKHSRRSTRQTFE